MIMAAVMLRNPFLDSDIPPPIPERSPKRRLMQRTIADRPSDTTRASAESHVNLSKHFVHKITPSSRPLSTGSSNYDDEIDSNDRSKLLRTLSENNVTDSYSCVANKGGKSSADRREFGHTGSGKATSSNDILPRRSTSTVDLTYEYPFSQAYYAAAGIKSKYDDNFVGSNFKTASRRTLHYLQKPQKALTRLTNSRLQIFDGRTDISPTKQKNLKFTGRTEKLYNINHGRYNGGNAHSQAREAAFLKAAIRQSQLLESERRKTREMRSVRISEFPVHSRTSYRPLQYNPEEQNPSPPSTLNQISCATAVAASTQPNIIVRPSNRSRILRSYCWWFFFALTSLGIIFTGAAVAMFIRSKEGGRTTEQLAGMVLWVVCAIGATLLGVIGCLCIWGMGKPKFVDFLRNVGFEELGCLPVFDTTKDTQEMMRRATLSLSVRMSRDLNGLASMQEASMAGVKLLSPEWQVLYPSQKNSRRSFEGLEKCSQLRGGESRGKELKSAPGNSLDIAKRENYQSGSGHFAAISDKQTQESSVAALILSLKNEDCYDCDYDTRGRGNNEISPTPKEKSQRRRPAILRRKSSNAFKKDHNTCDTQPLTEKPDETHNQLQPLVQRVLVSPSDGESDTLPTTASSEEYFPTIKANTDLPSSASAIVDRKHQTTHDSRNNQNDTLNAFGDASNEFEKEEISSILPVHSPLEMLAKELNTPELQALGEEFRAEYFASRRSLNEERDKHVKRRLSLAWTDTIGSTFSGGSVSIGNQPKYGGQHSPILEDERRDILRGDLNINKSEERGFSFLLDQAVAGAWESDYDMQNLEEESTAKDCTPSSTMEPTDESTIETLGKSTNAAKQDTPTKALNQIDTNLSSRALPRTREHPAQSDSQRKIPHYLNRKLKPMIRERVRTLEQMEHQVRNSSL